MAAKKEYVLVTGKVEAGPNTKKLNFVPPVESGGAKPAQAPAPAPVPPPAPAAAPPKK